MHKRIIYKNNSRTLSCEIWKYKGFAKTLLDLFGDIERWLNGNDVANRQVVSTFITVLVLVKKNAKLKLKWKQTQFSIL